MWIPQPKRAIWGLDRGLLKVPELQLFNNVEFWVASAALPVSKVARMRPLGCGALDPSGKMLW